MRTIEEVVDEIARYNSMYALDPKYVRGQIGTRLSEILMLTKQLSMGQRPTGHWINAKVGRLFPGDEFACSNCGKIVDFNGNRTSDAKFCPFCGADMRGEQNE